MKKLILAISFLIITTSLFGAVAYDNASSTYGEASNFSFSHTCSGTNRAIILEIAIRDSNGYTDTATYGGVSFTKITYGAGTNTYAELWYLLNAPSGSNTVSVSLDSSHKACVGVVSYNGVDTSGIGASTGKGTSSDAHIEIDLTTTRLNSYIVGIVAHDDASDTITNGTGVNTRWTQATGTGSTNTLARGHDLQASAITTYEMAFTFSGTDINGIAELELLEAPTPTATITRTRTQTLTPTITRTRTQTLTPTITRTRTQTITQTITSTITPTNTLTDTPTNTPTITPTFTITNTPLPTSTPAILKYNTILPVVNPIYTYAPVIIHTPVIKYP